MSSNEVMDKGCFLSLTKDEKEYKHPRPQTQKRIKKGIQLNFITVQTADRNKKFQWLGFTRYKKFNQNCQKKCAAEHKK